jgi:hypothetical protein
VTAVMTPSGVQDALRSLKSVSNSFNEMVVELGNQYAAKAEQVRRLYLVGDARDKSAPVSSLYIPQNLFSHFLFYYAMLLDLNAVCDMVCVRTTDQATGRRGCRRPCGATSLSRRPLSTCGRGAPDGGASGVGCMIDFEGPTARLPPIADVTEFRFIFIVRFLLGMMPRGNSVRGNRMYTQVQLCQGRS